MFSLDFDHSWKFFFCAKANIILNSRKFFLRNCSKKNVSFFDKKFAFNSIVEIKKQNTDFFQSTSFEELTNMTTEKNLSLTIYFYRKLCLPVIKWNKNYLSKQVGDKHTHWRNSFLQLLVLKDCELFLFRRSKKNGLHFGL